MLSLNLAVYGTACFEQAHAVALECLQLLGLQACGPSTTRTTCDCHQRPHPRKPPGFRSCQLASSKVAAVAAPCISAS